MEYLNRVVGIHVFYLEETVTSIPNFIHARYEIKKVTLDGKAAVFVYPKDELESVDVVKKHIGRISRAEGAPAVLVLDHLTHRQKEYLLRDHIPFVVDGKQIYLPFMAVYLQERGDREQAEMTALLPSAQLLLLYYIYQGCGELMTSRAVEGLGFTSTSISRASRQLEELGLIQMEKRGVQKVILTDHTPEELFNLAKGSLTSPVKRTIFVPKEELGDALPLSGCSALSEYSMMNPPMTETRAARSVAKWEKVSTNRMHNSEDQCAVELWRYDPKKLTDGRCVDRISLALALREDRDERVEEALEEMLKQVWRDIDGKRA
nr:MarR family transcriptional regulator [Clostridia bacterium]